MPVRPAGFGVGHITRGRVTQILAIGLLVYSDSIVLLGITAERLLCRVAEFIVGRSRSLNRNGSANQFKAMLIQYIAQ